MEVVLVVLEVLEVLGVLGVLGRLEDREGRGCLVVLGGLEGWTTQKRRWGTLAWAQGEVLGLTAGRLPLTLEGVMHLQKGE